MIVQKHCPDCGALLIEKEMKNEGMVPYCTECKAYHFPMFNVAVIMIVYNMESGKILLIQQYGRPANILVAGYLNRGEAAEDAVYRELKEETGMTPDHIRFNRTKFHEPTNVLMCNFTVFVKDDSQMHTNEEIDAYGWFTPDEARTNIKQGSLAHEFLNKYLDEAGL